MQLHMGRDDDEDNDEGNSWSTVQIVTPIAVGVGCITIGVALFLCYRSRRKHGRPSHSHSSLTRTRTLPIFHSFNSLPRVREADPDPDWTIDVDGSTDPYPRGPGHVRSSSATPLVASSGSTTNLSRRTEAFGGSGSGLWNHILLALMHVKWAMPWGERPVQIHSTQPSERWRIDGTPGPSRRTTAQAAVPPQQLDRSDDLYSALNPLGRDYDAEEEQLLSSAAPRPCNLAVSPTPTFSRPSECVHSAGNRDALVDDTDVVLISRNPGEDFTIESSEGSHQLLQVIPPSRPATPPSRHATPLARQAASSSGASSSSPPPSTPISHQMDVPIPPSPQYPPPTPSPPASVSPPLGAQHSQESQLSAREYARLHGQSSPSHTRGQSSSPDPQPADKIRLAASYAPSYERYYEVHSPTISPADSSSANTHHPLPYPPFHDDRPSQGPAGAQAAPSQSATLQPTASRLAAPHTSPRGPRALPSPSVSHERLPTYHEASLSARPLPTPSPYHLSPDANNPRGLQHQQFRSLGDMRGQGEPDPSADFQLGRLPARDRWLSADDLLAQPGDAQRARGR
ncbi:hypothetical protein BD626DRAFT_4401 [Schizophyllum amplum]|uniref:Uncharacterized protein n=1 Tax=Schizophyllum amplum TaxID=97359 RepID=A0A550CW67_9AGAR|nr:hypothetical protein BD626DRAFT_4401 [Auriculariopsis ampla]